MDNFYRNSYLSLASFCETNVNRKEMLCFHEKLHLKLKFHKSELLIRWENNNFVLEKLTVYVFTKYFNIDEFQNSAFKE